MERLLRWRRARKDYSQVVEFPVEIVGRDGQVRRFSFDESVRLYQRRILSAALRYEDPAEVDAEITHCQNRVEQLRRSYLEHFGWGLFRSNALKGNVVGSHYAAEIVSFLRRIFGEEPEGIASMLLTPLESGVTDSFFVQTSGRAFLLYAWRIDLPASKEACERFLTRLQEAPSGEGVERLLVRWSSLDVTVILTGTGAWTDAPVLEEAPPMPTGDPWLDGMRALYDGQVEIALSRLESGLQANPGRKVLAQTASLVAMLDGQAERSGFDAHTGLLYHPSDSLLRYCVVLSLCRTGRFGEAEVELCTLEAESIQENPLLLLALLLGLRKSDLRGTVARLRKLLNGTMEYHFLRRTTMAVVGWLVGWLLLLLASVGFTLGAIAALAAHLPIAGSILLAIALALLLPVPGFLRRHAEAVLRGEVKHLSLVSPECFPREKRAEPTH